jgi:hypothetical protein
VGAKSLATTVGTRTPALTSTDTIGGPTIGLYREFGEDFINDRRDALNLKAWTPLWDLRNQIACHSLGRRYIAIHVPVWTEGHYMGFRRVNRATLDTEYDEKVNLARLLRDWQEDVIVVLDEIQAKLERAVRGDGGDGSPAA